MGVSLHDMAVVARAWLGWFQLFVVLALALFLSAKTIAFPAGWAFLGVFFAATGAITVDLVRRDRALLERRIPIGPLAEKSALQKMIQAIAGLAFIAIFVAAGLDHRFGWSRVPWPLVVSGDVLVALGLFVVFRVFRVNTFTSATIETAAAQTVIDAGPYAHVRHPMYSGALVLLAGTALALGSWWSEVASAVVAIVVVVRLLDEERFLRRDLNGYAAYCEKVRCRVIPKVW